MTSYSERRDARAAATAPAGYVASTVALHQAYDAAVGWALQLGIKVYMYTSDGVLEMKTLGDLQDEIRVQKEALR